VPASVAPPTIVVPSGTAAPSASASAAPSASASAAPSAGADPAALPRDRGVLIMASRTDANVFVNGKLMGVTNDRIETTCGIRFVRLAKRDGSDPRVPSWIMAGQSIQIACQAVTTARMDPP